MLRKLPITLFIAAGLICVLGCSAKHKLDKETKQVGQAQEPKSSFPKVRTTANQMGFEDTEANDLLKKFLNFAPAAPGHLMDLGCAKGFAIQEMLALETKKPFLSPRNKKIFAVDMSKEHIEFVAKNTPGDLVKTFQIRFPETESPDVHRCFAPDTLGAVYAGLIFHYLNGPELRQGLKLLLQSIAPGGRLYASVNSALSAENMKKDFLHRKNVLKEEYPGWFENYESMLPSFIRGQSPSYLHVFDKETLTRYAKDAGFNVIDCSYFYRGSDMMKMEQVGIIAEKPNN